jgi:exonuclease VII large subunit
MMFNFTSLAQHVHELLKNFLQFDKHGKDRKHDIFDPMKFKILIPNSSKFSSSIKQVESLTCEREEKQLDFQEETYEFTKRFTTIESKQKLKRKLRNSQQKICNKTQQLQKKTLEFIERNKKINHYKHTKASDLEYLEEL